MTRRRFAHESFSTLSDICFVSLLPLTAAASQFETPRLLHEGSGGGKIVLSVEVGEQGAPAGFTIEWMTQADFIAEGGWVEPEQAAFVGTPTLNAWGVEDSFALVAWGSATVEMGICSTKRVSSQRPPTSSRPPRCSSSGPT